MTTFRNTNNVNNLRSFFESEKERMLKVFGADIIKNIDSAICTLEEYITEYEYKNFKGGN